MVKFFVTGDNHIGKKYDRYPEVKEKLVESRFAALKAMIKKAEDEACELFIITGDLFDNVNNIRVSDVKKVAEILASFNGIVFVLPGNHDYYTGDEKVWSDFEDAISKIDHNILIAKEFRTYSFDTANEEVIIYPAFCHSKHSKENNLSWIKNSDIQKQDVINIGVAHGAIKGITPDINQEYFLMTESELNAIPVDAWFIGHTHIPYPADLSEDKEITGYKIFNAGTHQQTDLHNMTEGNGFIISVEKEGEISKVVSKKYVSGLIRFHDLCINVSPNSENALQDAVALAIKDLSNESIIRMKISGSVKQAEYERKDELFKDSLNKFLSYEIIDEELSEEITVEKIRSEYSETSFAAKFMEALIDNPTELQMTYDLLKKCKND